MFSFAIYIFYSDVKMLLLMTMLMMMMILVNVIIGSC